MTHEANDAAGVWNELVASLATAGEILVAPDAPTDPAAQAAGVLYLLNLLNSGMEMHVFTADPFRAEIGRPQDPSKRWGLDCPDAHYSSVSIAADSTYVLRLAGGSPHYLGVTVTAGSLGTAGVRHIGGLSSPGALVAADDGSVELVVGPGAVGVNAIDTNDGGSSLSIRQFLYDWDTEVPHRLTIERVAGPARDEARQAELVLERVRRLARFMATSSVTWHGFVADLRERAHNTVLPINPLASQYGGTPDNAYGSGHLELADDEAAIIEVTPPPCHYWNVQFGDHWFQSLDYTYRQTALNGFQAHLDHGRFVGVIAHDDPGIANWFDTCGNRELPMTYRWQLARIPRDELPAPSLRVVKRAVLDDAVPTWVRRVTPAEREASLDARRRAVLRRFGRG